MSTTAIDQIRQPVHGAGVPGTSGGWVLAWTRPARTARRLVAGALAAALLVPLGSQAAEAQSRPPQSGEVWSWGSNLRGELGDGTTDSRLTPGPVPVLPAAVAVAAGRGSQKQESPAGAHNLALDDQGTVWAWGTNASGQLGDGTTETRPQPQEVAGPIDVIAVAAGGDHSLALDDQGTVWAWGSNAFGQLGDGTTGPGSICFPLTLPRSAAAVVETEPSPCHRAEPAQVPHLDDVVAIAAGRHHSLALRRDKTLWAWGYNASGQLGDGTTENRNRPLQVLSDVRAFSAGDSHSLAVLADETAWGWGHNLSGQLGDGTTVNRSEPVSVSGLGDVRSVSAGVSHSLAVLADGTVRAWGWNVYGQLGDGSHDDRLVPVTVNGLSGVTSVATGSLHSLAVLADGSVRAWGSNGSGQLGDGSTEARPEPQPVSALRGVHAIGAGPSHSLALMDAMTAGAPSDLTAMPEWPPPAWAQGGARVELSWDAPDADGGRPITGYRISRAPDGVVIDVSADITAATITGLDYGQAYTFSVAALTDRGAGPVATAEVTPRSLPGTPTGVKATAGIESATIDFTVPPDGGSPFTAFSIRVCAFPLVCSLDGGQNDALSSPWTPGETLTRTLSPLNCCTPHRFEVRFANDYGWGPWAVSNEVTPGDSASAPDAPIEVAAKAGVESAIVRWDPPRSDGGAPITHYRVTASDGRVVYLDGATTSTTVSGLTAGVGYAFVVTAANRTGYGPASAESNQVMPTPPSVTDLSRAVGLDPLGGATSKPRLELRWTKQGAPDAIEVSWSEGSTSRSVTLTPAPSSHTVTDLTQGKTYTFRVRAVKGGAKSVPASVSAFGSILTANVKEAVVTLGSSTTVSGKLTRAGTPTALGGRAVQLQVRTQDASGLWSAWSHVGSVVRTTSTGRYAIAHRTPRNARYRVVFAGAGRHLGSVSPVRAVSVAPKITSRLSTASMSMGATARFTGRVSPNLAGKPIHLQRKADGRWIDVTGMSRTLSSTSTYSFAIKLSRRGTWSYRLRVPASVPYVRGVGPSRTLTAY